MININRQLQRGNKWCSHFGGKQQLSIQTQDPLNRREITTGTQNIISFLRLVRSQTSEHNLVQLLCRLPHFLTSFLILSLYVLRCLATTPQQRSLNLQQMEVPQKTTLGNSVEICRAWGVQLHLINTHHNSCTYGSGSNMEDGTCKNKNIRKKICCKTVSPRNEAVR